MLKDFNRFQDSRPEKLVSRIWKGLPDPVRGQVWVELSGAREHFPIEEWSKKEVPRATANQIALDVPRTLPTNEFFSQLDPETGMLTRNEEGHMKLAQLLHAYAAIDSEVGYCQGMNFVAAIPLFYMTPQQALEVFVFLMRELNYRSYFLPGFPRLKSSILILEALVEANLPRLCRHLKRYDVQLSFFVTQWFLTLFTYNLPFPAIIRIWDWLFIEGHDVIFTVCLAILKLVQAKMLALEGQDLLEYVMTFSAQLDLTADQLIQRALEYKQVRHSVKKLRLRNAAMRDEDDTFDLYATKQRYSDAPFFLRHKG
eukprot:c16397_g1_i1.p1 GENE.c16397_g1_i1~~c16397_g1_i1.p1  ORF type:complete len:313 (+),score=75.66 c16397_g1_i1:359-1297(+)